MSTFKIILWAIMAAAIMFVLPQVFILLLLGLSPTIVAFMIDRSPHKYSAFCVGGMNIAGVFPSFLTLWNGNNSIRGAMEILTNPFDLTIMFAGAAFGWLLYVAIPPVIKSLLTVIAQHQIAVLREEQKELIKNWGEGIAIGPRAIEAREAEQESAPPGEAAELGEFEELGENEPIDLFNEGGTPEAEAPPAD